MARVFLFTEIYEIFYEARRISMAAALKALISIGLAKCLIGFWRKKAWMSGEKYPDKSLAQLYDPTKMPIGMKEVHQQNDMILERCYRSKPFDSDDERLEHLLKLYEQMIEEEKDKGSLFEKQKKTRKRR